MCTLLIRVLKLCKEGKSEEAIELSGFKEDDTPFEPKSEGGMYLSCFLSHAVVLEEAGELQADAPVELKEAVEKEEKEETEEKEEKEEEEDDGWTLVSRRRK